MLEASQYIYPTLYGKRLHKGIKQEAGIVVSERLSITG